MPGTPTPKEKPQPWAPADATRTINQLGRSSGLDITYTQHAREQMSERDLIAGDVIFALRSGFVHHEAQTSTQNGLFKYRIDSRTPNSGNRVVRVVAIPSVRDVHIKIVTVMWVDE